MAPGARAVSATVRRAGEPFRFGLDPRELPGYLAERGLEPVEDATGAELAERYLRPLGRRGEGSPFFHVALTERATA